MDKKRKGSTKVMVNVMREAGGFVASYAYPGMVPEFVMNGNYRAVFQSEQDAKLAGFEALQSRWNRHLIDNPTARNFFGVKPSPADLKARMDDLWIDVALAAALEGTTTVRVMDWLAGNESAPFHLHWSWDFLTKEGALEEAISKIHPRLSQKQDYREFRNRMATFDTLRDRVRAAAEDQREIAAAWEAEHPGERHRSRDILEEFDSVADQNSSESLNVRWHRLNDLAGKFGILFDVNEEIKKQNEPYFREITRKRLTGMTEERRARKAIEANRSARLKDERDAQMAAEQKRVRERRGW